MSKPLANILLTFDHELFLGEQSGNVWDCMINPVQALVPILEKHKVKAVFFVDLLCLQKYSMEPTLKNEHVALVEQVKMLHKLGHYIYPHFHPHWLDAKFLDKQKGYNLSDVTRYSMSGFSENEIDEFFNNGLNYLKKQGITYSNWGYRAGGWCIQPFDKFRKAFDKYQVLYDFSVLPGYRNTNEFQRINFVGCFSNAPYTFNDNELEPNKEGKFTEYPISVIRFRGATRFLDKVYRKVLWKLGHRGFGKGRSAQGGNLTGPFNSGMATFDLATIPMELKYRKHLSSEKYLHFISHPKMLTHHSLKCLDRFLTYANQNFEIESDHRKMKPSYFSV